MLVKLSTLISEARGSTGGTVFSRNRAGAYTRNRTKPVDPSSPKQNIQRTIMSGSVVAWRNLTADQRDLFNAKALSTSFTNRIGESFHPSGMNLFMRGHQLLLAVGRDGVTEPPVTPVRDDKGTYIAYQVDPGLEIYTTIADWELDVSMLIQFQKNLTNSTYFYKGPYAITRIYGNANFIPGMMLLTADADLDVDSTMHACWRVVHNDGSASAIRYGRAFKPPAA